MINLIIQIDKRFLSRSKINIVISDSDKQAWKEPHILKLIGDNSQDTKREKIWLLGISVRNDGPVLAEDCESHMHFDN